MVEMCRITTQEKEDFIVPVERLTEKLKELAAEGYTWKEVGKVINGEEK